MTLSGLFAHRVRYALTAFSVLMGVAFLAGTLVFTDTIRHTFDGLFSDVYRNTSAVVRAREPYSPQLNFATQRRPIDARLVATVDRVPGVVATRIGVEGYAQLVGSDGKAIGNPAAGAPTLGEAWNPDAGRMNPYRMLPGGHPPRTGTQIAIDKHSADVGHLSVGDRVVVLTKQRPRAYTLTGIVTWESADSPLGASITLFDLNTAERVLTAPGKVGEIDVAAAPGITQQQMVARLRNALHDPGLQVVTGAAVTAEGQRSVHQALAFFDTFLLIFAGVALFVGCFLIFNTFSIVVAQRLRELALLRAVGAGRLQLVRSVLGESLVIGLTASATGVGAGLGLAVGLRALLSAAGLGVPATGLVVTSHTVVTSMAVGTLITLAAALAPAWKAGQIAPVAALRDVELDEGTSTVRRLAAGLTVTACGLGALFLGLYAGVAHRMSYVGVGAVLVFLGVAITGPTISRGLARLLGAPLAWRRASGQLARNNAARTPKRTSAAAAALTVGIALVTLVSIMASSSKRSVDATIDSGVRADFIISAGRPGGVSGLSPSLQRQLSALPEVAAATGIRSASARIDGTTGVALAADTRHLTALFALDVRHGSLARMTPRGIAISQRFADAKHLAVGDTLPVEFTTSRATPFVVQAVYGARSLAGDYVLPLAAADQFFSSQLDFQVYVRLAAGVATADGRRAIERVAGAYPNATVMDRAQYENNQHEQIDQLLNLMYGLLGLGLVIALVGIANTLALSIHERTRELGLLRAVGMTRGQVRAAVRAEAVIIALIGTCEGLALGSLLGWAVVSALKTEGITTLSIPLAQLALVVVLATVAGVVAAGLPGRRAARLNVLAAISTA